MTKPTSQPAHSPAVEDYIKQIYKLSHERQKATTKALADRMALGQGTVSGMLKQLAERGLVHHQPYYGVRLTDDGHRLAMNVLRRHRLIELFLVEMLGYTWDAVDEESEQLEHAVSDRFIDRIDELLGRPEVDPHGSPIPDARGRIEKQDFKPLSELAIGQIGTVRRVSDSNPKFLQYLAELGIGLEAKVEVIASGPFGSMQVRVGNQRAALPREATEQIAVTPGA